MHESIVELSRNSDSRVGQFDDYHVFKKNFEDRLERGIHLKKKKDGKGLWTVMERAILLDLSSVGESTTDSQAEWLLRLQTGETRLLLLLVECNRPVYCKLKK